MSFTETVSTFISTRELTGYITDGSKVISLATIEVINDTNRAHSIVRRAVNAGYREKDAVMFAHVLTSELADYLDTDDSNERAAVLLFCSDDAAAWLASH